MEISPLYCDVIVRRWEQFTGKKAKHIKAKRGRSENTPASAEVLAGGEE
jgi:DNA modification methylase